MSSSIIPLISLVLFFCLPSLIFGQYDPYGQNAQMNQAYNPYAYAGGGAGGMGGGVGSSFPYTSMNLQTNMQQPPMVCKKEKISIL